MRTALSGEFDGNQGTYRHVRSTEVSVGEVDGEDDTKEDPGSGQLEAKVILNLWSGRRGTRPYQEECRSAVVSFCDTPEICLSTARSRARSARSSALRSSYHVEQSDISESMERIIQE